MNKKELTQWVRIAKTGTFTDSNGRQHTFTDADFDAITDGYDPAKQEAALCFGHPKDSDPAFGWVQNLKRENNELFAQFAQVPAKVKKLVDDGYYRHVSMSLSPDKKRLLHVGLLGAAAPAIDGLGPVSFNENDGITINFSASDTTAEENGGNMDPAELQRQIIELQKKIAELTAENEKLKTEKSGADTDKAEAEKKATDIAAEFSAFKDNLATTKREERVQALIASGRLEPAKKEETLSFATALSQVAVPVNFSAADGKTEEISAEERYFRELEDRQPSQLAVNFSSMAPAPTHAADNTDPAYNLSDITSKL